MGYFAKTVKIDVKYTHLALFLLQIFICCKNSGTTEVRSSLIKSIDTARVDYPYSLKVTESSGGSWGYSIQLGSKVVIDQLTIPAIGENRKFKSRDDAKKVGDLVLKKLSSRRELPSVSIFELDSLKIKY